MAAITWSQVELLASELSAVDAGAQALILEYVNTGLNVAVWGGEESVKLKLARIYLAAHMGALAKQAADGLSGVAGPVYEVTEGDATVRFADIAGSATDAALGQTPYGQEYDRLRATSAARIGDVP